MVKNTFLLLELIKKINKNCIFADFVASQRHKPQIIQGLAFSVKSDAHDSMGTNGLLNAQGEA